VYELCGRPNRLRSRVQRFEAQCCDIWNLRFFCPQHICVFCMLLLINSITFRNGIKWLLSVTETNVFLRGTIINSKYQVQKVQSKYVTRYSVQFAKSVSPRPRFPCCVCSTPSWSELRVSSTGATLIFRPLHPKQADQEISIMVASAVETLSLKKFLRLFHIFNIFNIFNINSPLLCPSAEMATRFLCGM
jgi:hypothetical protein